MEHLSDLVEDLRNRLVQVRLGGSEKARQKHHDRGKLTARERVDRLLDPGSPFLELSALAAEIPGARLLLLEGAGHGVERHDWRTIVDAVIDQSSRRA